MNGALIFIAGILVIIMVHEAGHFTMAKLFGFKATKLFLGFGPTLWSFKKGETEYGIKALPLGGFVKIVGMNPYEEVPAEDLHRSYPNKPRWQRALVLLGGPATHWPLAFVLLTTLAMTIGFPTGDVTNEIAMVQTATEGDPLPAEEAGLRLGDRIVAVGGERTTQWEEIRSFIQAHPGDRVTFTIERDGTERDLEIVPAYGVFDEEGTLLDQSGDLTELDVPPGTHVSGFLGVSPKERFEKEGLFGAMREAGSTTVFFTKASIQGVGQIFLQPFTADFWSALTTTGARDLTDKTPIGIVGATRIASSSLDAGRALELWSFIAGFTIFIGLMNLLPLPPLDGGHLTVVAYEWLRSTVREVKNLGASDTALGAAIHARAGGDMSSLRTHHAERLREYQVDMRKLIPVAAVVISFFVLLFIAVLYLDLARPIEIPF